MVRVYLRHFRELKYCSRGSRKFFERHGWDWHAFLLNGLEAEKFHATGDAMAIKAAHVAEAHAGPSVPSEAKDDRRGTADESSAT